MAKNYYICNLPAQTPYGNFYLKTLKLVIRADEVNKNIISCYDAWDKSMILKDSKDLSLYLSMGNCMYNYTFSSEIAVYHLKKICDELISLTWCLDAYLRLKEYPDKVSIDSIGKYLSNKNTQFKYFEKFIDILNKINCIENAYKHSFINTDLTAISKDEPSFIALGLVHNSKKETPAFYFLPIKNLIDEFNIFYKEAISIIKNLGSQINSLK